MNILRSKSAMLWSLAKRLVSENTGKLFSRQNYLGNRQVPLTRNGVKEAFLSSQNKSTSISEEIEELCGMSVEEKRENLDRTITDKM